jgi:hypothetical protein
MDTPVGECIDKLGFKSTCDLHLRMLKELLAEPWSLAHASSLAGILHHSKKCALMSQMGLRATLVVGRPVPVYPDQRTFPGEVGVSQRCHERTCATTAASTVAAV